MVGVMVVWAAEVAAGGLVLAALLAERPVPLAVTAGLLALVAAGARFFPRTREGLALLFRARRAEALFGAAILALALPLFLRTSPSWTFVVTLALVYVTLAHGLNLQIGTAGVINLAGAAFGFIFAILMNNLEFTGGPQGIKNIPTLRPPGYAFTTPPRLFGLAFPYHVNFYYAALLVAAGATALAWQPRNSWVGLTLNTLRDDEIAARCSGVSAARHKLLAFSLGNVLIGLGGAFYAVMVGFVSPPDFDFGYSLVMLSIIILGGLDSVPAMVLGACLLIPLPERFRLLHEYRLLIYGLAIILMPLFRPRGLWPAGVRRFGLREPGAAFGSQGPAAPAAAPATGPAGGRSR